MVGVGTIKEDAAAVLVPLVYLTYYEQESVLSFL